MDKYKKLLEKTSKLNVLYAEDDDVLREKTVSMLKTFFKSVDPCPNGKEALELYIKNGKSSFYDLIVTDINMPVMNGLKLCEEIFKLDQNQQIIIISAYNDSENLEKIIDLGVRNYIHKPYDITKLINILEKATIQIEQKKLSPLKDLSSLFGIKGIQNLHDDIKDFQDHCVVLIYLKNFDTMQTVYGIEQTESKIIELIDSFSDFTGNKQNIYAVSQDKLAYFMPGDLNIIKFIEQAKLFLKQYEFDTVIGASRQSGKLIITANMALNFALEHGLEYKIFSSDIDLTDKYKNELLFKPIINNAVKEDLIYPVFQPIFDRNKNILKYEVLMRISQIDENGLEQVFYPSQFMDILQISNMYNTASFIVIEKAFNKMSKSEKQFSINISYNDISNTVLTNYIEKQILKYDGIGERLVLEILETDFIKDYELVRRFIDKFKKYGVNIALDDFGSGYSNLNHIVSFQSDYVKLDGTLIKNIQNDNKSLAIVKSIVFFAKELGIKTIAEYVATEEIFNIVSSLGVDEFQGFYLCKPLREIDE